MFSLLLRTVTRYALFLFVLLAGASAAKADLIGATGGNSATGELVDISTTNGSFTVIGNLVDISSNPYAMTGLAFQPGTGVLYGLTSNRSGTNPNSLVTINPATGLVTEIGLPGVGAFGDIKFSPTSGILYGFGNNGNLYTINLTTGAATLVGSSGNTNVIRGAGMAADSSGVLWGTPDSITGLYTYSTSNGAETLVTPFSGASLIGHVSALSFDPSDGTLFGADETNGGATDLITIDTSTGFITDIGSTVNNLDAMDFSPTQVPEPSSLILLTLTAAGAASHAWRRRRTLQPK